MKNALKCQAADVSGSHDMHAWEVAIVDVAMGYIRAVTVLLVDPLLPAAIGVDRNEVVYVRVLVASRAGSIELACGGEIVLSDGDVLPAP